MQRQSNNVTSYIQDFSVKAKKYLDFKCDENLTLFNRAASMLCTVKNLPELLSTSFASLETTNFFIDMYSILEVLSAEHDVFWTCLTVLHQTIKNLKIQKALVNDFHFMVPLTKILQKFQSQEKVERVLTLLQDMSYGITVTWEESYLTVLMKKLIECIYCDDFDESVNKLATSVLINLCHNNFVVTCLLLRSVNISSLTKRIMPFDIFASKLMIILDYVPSSKDLEKFIKSNFLAVKNCMNAWDVPCLTHIVEFIQHSENNKEFHEAVREYPLYGESLREIVDHLVGRSEMDDSTDDCRKNQQKCILLICQLLKYLIQLVGGKLAADLYPTIYEFLEKWIDSEIAGCSVLELLVAMIETDEKSVIANKMSRDPSVINQIIGITENNNEANEFTASALRLILVLLRKSKTEKIILTKITESFFDKILQPLNVGNSGIIGQYTQEEVAQCIYCILVLVEFSHIAKQAYFEKVCNILHLNSTQFILAKGMLGQNQQICEAVFEISLFEHFPRSGVSKFVAQQIPLLTPKFQKVDRWPNGNEQHTSISRDVEERLDALLSLMEKTNQSAGINSVATSQLIEVYGMKLTLMKGTEKHMDQKLQSANQEVIHLSQQVAIQKAELEKIHSMNYRLHLNQERLQTECKDLSEQKTNLKSNLTNLMKKMNEQAESLKVNEKRLEVKSSEFIVVSEKYAELTRKYDDKTEELDKLKAMSKEYASRIDKLKKTVEVCESDIKEKKRSIDEKEREIAKYSKSTEDFKESLGKSENMIKLLETQITEKNEVIRGYESELSETEEMRKTILSLMESKRPKRK